MLRAASILLAGLVLLTSLAGFRARAQADASTAAPAPSPPLKPLDPRVALFWQAARNPDIRRAQTLIRQGRAQLYPALGSSAAFGSEVATHRRSAIDNALARFSRARKLEPRNPEVHFLSGKALSIWETRLPDGRVQRRDREAIARYSELRLLDPRYEEYQVAFDMGILHTRQGHFARAIAEYRRALGVHLDEGTVATVVSNLAEVTMMAGNLDEAVLLYEKALKMGSNEDRLLPMWGLAVALDRLGERAASQDLALQAADEDRRPMAVLRAPGVFFVPYYEEHYYQGLGQLALATRELGQPLSECKRGLMGKGALSAASRELLLNVVQLLDDIGARAKSKPLAALRKSARSLLDERNASVRRGARISRTSGKPALALGHALSSLRSWQRYLAYGGKKSTWATEVKGHIEDIERCVGL